VEGERNPLKLAGLVDHRVRASTARIQQALILK
jgi:hypothetical protein